MLLFIVGLDHHTSPVELRERVAFHLTQLPEAFDRLVHDAGAPLHEAAILSTCNRVEIYAIADDDERACPAVVNFLHSFHHLGPDQVTPALYCHTGRDAVAHLLSTTCGLNSMIVGEPQIQAQVRNAAGAASKLHASGPLLHTLFQRAIETGKRARSETNISCYATSVSHAGVELAKQLLGDLGATRVLLVGSGEVSELAAKNLVDNGVRSIRLINRSAERAQALAERWGGQALPFEALPSALCEADVVLSSTAAPHTIIQAEHIRGALQGRPDRQLLLIDLAVPRDIDPDVATVDGAYVYDIDDLQHVVASNLERRRDELDAVQRIVAEETAHFMNWLCARAVVPTLSRLRKRADAISRGEFERAIRRLPELDDQSRGVIEAMATGIVNKLLHMPTTRLKHAAACGEGAAYADVLHFLFDLDASAPPR